MGPTKKVLGAPLNEKNDFINNPWSKKSTSNCKPSVLAVCLGYLIFINVTSGGVWAEFDKNCSWF